MAAFCRLDCVVSTFCYAEFESDTGPAAGASGTDEAGRRPGRRPGARRPGPRRAGGAAEDHRRRDPGLLRIRQPGRDAGTGGPRRRPRSRAEATARRRRGRRLRVRRRARAAPRRAEVSARGLAACLSLRTQGAVALDARRRGRNRRHRRGRLGDRRFLDRVHRCRQHGRRRRVRRANARTRRGGGRPPHRTAEPAAERLRRIGRAHRATAAACRLPGTAAVVLRRARAVGRSARDGKPRARSASSMPCSQRWRACRCAS